MLTPVSGARITVVKKDKKSRPKTVPKDHARVQTPPTVLSDSNQEKTSEIVALEIVSNQEKRSPKSRQKRRLKKSKAVVLEIDGWKENAKKGFLCQHYRIVYCFITIIQSVLKKSTMITQNDLDFLRKNYEINSCNRMAENYFTRWGLHRVG